MKSGLNYVDINTLKEYLRFGGNLDELAQKIRVTRPRIDKYIASMDPEELAQLKASAPVGADLNAIKAELKAEMMEELYAQNEPQEPESEEASDDAESDDEEEWG